MLQSDSNTKLDKLGILIIESLKDKQLDILEWIFKGGYSYPNIKSFQDKVSNLDAETKRIIFDCVSIVIMNGIQSFLSAIEERHHIEGDISITVDNENILFLTDDEINIEPTKEDGWEARFSKYPTMAQIYEKYDALRQQKNTGIAL